MNTQEGGKRPILPWPWNWLLTAVVAVALGFVMGFLWSVLVIVLFFAILKKRNPGPAGGSYCLERTRKNLLFVLWGLLALLLTVAVGVYLWSTYQEGTLELWELALGGVILALGILMTVVFFYVGIQDAFFPEKSTLAQSIRSQLPYPEEAPPVQELFAMVDRDIAENGQWFDRVAVGKEWVLGDMATYIPRIRGIFGRDEIRRQHTGSGSSRILELHLVDDRHQSQSTTLHSPNELKAVISCLQLRVPEAASGNYSDYERFQAMSDEAWQKWELEFRRNKALRETKTGPSAPSVPQDMTLTAPDGTKTSRVTETLLRQTLAEAQAAEEALFVLTPSRPVGGRFSALECVAGRRLNGQVSLLLREAPSRPGEPERRGMHQMTSPAQAERVLLEWFRQVCPNLEGWDSVPLAQPHTAPTQRETIPPKLVLINARGVSQGHDTFTLEDVEVAAQGIVDGTYHLVDLTLPGGFLWIQVAAGDASDGRCTVKVTRPDPKELRFFQIKCTHRQAAAWLLEYARGDFHPDWSQWKDYTKAARKKT